jgi:hypothetical protein
MLTLKVPAWRSLSFAAQRLLEQLLAGLPFAAEPFLRRVRSFPGFLAPGRGARHRPRLSYAEWIARFDTLTDRDRALMRRHIARFAAYPRLTLLVATNAGGAAALEATLASVRCQLYRHAAVIVLDVAGILSDALQAERALPELGPGSRVVPQGRVAACLATLNEAWAHAGPDEWLALLPAGERLAEQALYRYACAALAAPGASFIYGDDDEMDPDGARRHPRFKPDWSPEHLRSTHYVGEAAAFAARAAAAAGGVTVECCERGNYDLLLRLADRVRRPPVHVPAVLHHGAGGARADSGARRRALAAHLARNGVRARVEEARPGCLRLRYVLPEAPPLVSVIVPTRDAPTLLRGCVESVLRCSTYPRYELIVVDNASTDRYALAYLADLVRRPRVRVLRYDKPFNYSAINNFAARQARGEVLCLLNNDTAVISPDWMEEMLGHLLQPGVGAVGAKLYFRDGRVQHAGDAVGPGGCANHLHPGLPRGEPGYCDRAAIAQELSAVTAASTRIWAGWTRCTCPWPSTTWTIACACRRRAIAWCGRLTPSSTTSSRRAAAGTAPWPAGCARAAKWRACAGAGAPGSPTTPTTIPTSVTGSPTSP